MMEEIIVTESSTLFKWVWVLSFLRFISEDFDCVNYDFFVHSWMDGIWRPLCAMDEMLC